MSVDLRSSPPLSKDRTVDLPEGAVDTERIATMQRQQAAYLTAGSVGAKKVSIAWLSTTKPAW